MRVIRELSFHHSKVTFFAWNNRYLVKFEQGFLEQTFKINQSDVQDEDSLVRMIDNEFVLQVERLFMEMAKSLAEAKGRVA